jgi:hypothetical protein
MFPISSGLFWWKDAVSVPRRRQAEERVAVGFSQCRVALKDQTGQYLVDIAAIAGSYGTVTME